MGLKKLHGKDGELILVHKGVLFARAERFTAELIEHTALVNTASLGKCRVGVGYKVRLKLNDVTITEEQIIDALIDELNGGTVPEIGFQGKFKRKDAFQERIAFNQCILTGEIDLIGFARGFVWDLELDVNNITQEQLDLFRVHG